MIKRRNNFIQGVGVRLRELREHFNYSVEDMAARLGIKANSYYKNESETTLPGMQTLSKLHNDLGISLNWLYFGHGPMRLEDIPEKQEQDELAEKPEPSPEIKELVESMERDKLLRHKVLIYFHEQEDKKKKGTG